MVADMHVSTRSSENVWRLKVKILYQKWEVNDFHFEMARRQKVRKKNVKNREEKENFLTAVAFITVAISS
jgi:hypothetical protein